MGTDIWGLVDCALSQGLNYSKNEKNQLNSVQIWCGGVGFEPHTKWRYHPISHFSLSSRRSHVKTRQGCPSLVTNGDISRSSPIYGVTSTITDVLRRI